MGYGGVDGGITVVNGIFEKETNSVTAPVSHDPPNAIGAKRKVTRSGDHEHHFDKLNRSRLDPHNRSDPANEMENVTSALTY